MNSVLTVVDALTVMVWPLWLIVGTIAGAKPSALPSDPWG